ncbi:hypothetical protein GBA52_011210 [Prunus armeniaca]|nr:hypothetical protein GBA52_011210 [Prunus armeniaca]
MGKSISSITEAFNGKPSYDDSQSEDLQGFSVSDLEKSRRFAISPTTSVSRASVRPAVSEIDKPSRGFVESNWKVTRVFCRDSHCHNCVDGSDSLKINIQHLRELSFRVGSIYQFIGEPLIQPDNEAVLQARVGRNVDGVDLNLYYQSLQLLRQFQAHHLKNPAT